MAYHRGQFEDLIKRTLAAANLPRKQSAIDLLLGTAAQESAFGTYLKQVNGPALGVFQMEPATFRWVASWGRERYPTIPLWTMYTAIVPDMLEFDLRIAVVFARLNYLSKPGVIPDSLQGQAAYWKRHWNTYLGKGTIEQYVRNWHKYVV